jgi:hypothetical protein
MPSPPNSSRFDHPNNIGEQYRMNLEQKKRRATQMILLKVWSSVGSFSVFTMVYD